jgi:CO/xanthine dehydrogenase FAD-binding subunit
MIPVETFETHREAASALGESALFLGGGTLLMRDVNYAAPGLAKLVRSREPMRDIRAEGGRVVIGAGATMSDVIAAPETEFLAPVARAVGGPAIRNMATVGGNLFAPHPYGDFAAALLALDAMVRWVDGQEEPIATFLSRRAGARGVVTAVSLAPPATGSFRFAKVSRVRPKGASVMSIAVRLPSSGQEARIAYGAMGDTPLRAAAAEAALASASLNEQGVTPVVAAATEGLSPPDDALASAWYRREVAPVHLRRLLLRSANS